MSSNKAALRFVSTPPYGGLLVAFIITLVRRRSFVVCSSQGERLVYLKNGLIEFYGQIQSSILYKPRRILRHQLLPVGSFREKKLSKMPPPMAFGEFLQNGLSEDHKMLLTCREHSASQTYNVTSCFPKAA